ncbi:MAG TPA: universal stress protein [Pyrinomonadaceae bacterium]|nr:universal stress protein [Pyrinomonadaceae bacterium]
MKILVAYDGSDGSDAALKDLARAGLPDDTEVLVMSLADVFLPPDDPFEEVSTPYVPETVKLAHERAQQKLGEAQDMARRASEQIKSMFPTWNVHHEALADSPAWGLLRTADQWTPDLVVMGARGQSARQARLILGSISQRVLYEARGSVRISRPPRKNADEPVFLLIGNDDSADSTAAVEAVCRRRWPKGSEVALLTVRDSVLETTPNPSEPSQASAEKLRDAGLHVNVLVKQGNAADEILEEADAWGADCIFVGAKGTRGIGRLLLGSVSSSVAARAHCSVEVVRPKS